ncbi:MAG: WhiB family transcriptional regulator [Actinomycetota bacterium]|nr:WhiB family transcriptional regulator [Actinomycetota bacterium]
MSIAVCRRPGCIAPATDDIIQLCAAHLEAQRRQAEAIRAEAAEAAGGRASTERITARQSPGPALDQFGIGERPSWQARAACSGVGPETFYPTQDAPGGQRGPDPYLDARQLCATCPVVEPCRVAGRTERYGMWAGTTPAERGKGKRRRTAA